MYPNKTFCAPIYLGPKQIRHEALEGLKTLEDSKPRQWVDDSTIFLNKDGSFSLKMIDEGSFRVRTLKASLFMVNLFSSRKLKASEEEKEEEQRLHHARRRLLVSLLAHAWLWRRPEVLDNNGNLVAFEDREVLAPEKILEFLSDTRFHTTGCRCENIRDFLEKVQEVPLHKDTSKWNMMGAIACLKWDKSHSRYAEGPWCSCRLTKERELFPPSYHEACLTKNQNFSVGL
jgi:hypothetical protein